MPGMPISIRPIPVFALVEVFLEPEPLGLGDFPVLIGGAGAGHEGWLGEIEGIDLTLSFLRDKRAEALRVQQREPIHLGLPAVGSWNGS